MQKILPKGIFPSQSEKDAVKAGKEYGLEVAKAIEGEWFKKEGGATRYHANRDNFHKLRQYARGEQSIQKYKDELSINGDLSYLNLDWKPVPIIPKFVDIVVNGIESRPYAVNAYAQDPASINEKTQYINDVLNDMYAYDIKTKIKEKLGVNTFNTPQESVPGSEEELQLHIQLNYKQNIEIAAEEAISNVFDHNKYDHIQNRLAYDLVTIGIAAHKNSFNTAEGIKIEYVDPADLVYSYTDSPYFDDLYYVGEIRRTTITELKKQYPELTDEDVKEIENTGSNHENYNRSYNYSDSEDTNHVYVLYFEYKTYKNQVYKLKETATGAEKIIKKDDTFNPPKDQRSRFEKVNRSIEVLYTGAKVIGMNKLLEWKLAENMTRPKSDTTKVQMSYNIVAPRYYKGKIESLVGRMTTFADMIQLTHLKLQQVLSRMVPDGVYLDADGIAEIDLGNGTYYSPQEALNMYFQTGSIIGRSMTQDGEFNHSRTPIQELQSSAANAKISSLINSYNYYMSMIRDVTGLNEARDGSSPDKNALVGVQKLAAANSNTATRHIVQSVIYLASKAAEAACLRVSDVLEYGNTTASFISGIGKVNVSTLSEIKDLHLHDFGIFIEVAPDEEERQFLESNIQIALQRDQIGLDDVIDIRNVKNISLANQLLKLRKTKKMERDQAIQQQNIQAQTQSNIQSSQAAAEADMQKKQALTQMESQIEQVKANLNMQKLEREAALKLQLMEREFQFNLQLKQAELQVINERDRYKEDRKDKRTKIQASQQSELIDQRKNSGAPKNFESAGFDGLGGFGLEQFEPR
jgi:hypothetical protein